MASSARSKRLPRGPLPATVVAAGHAFLHPWLVPALVALGVAVRVVLWWINPPLNAFDNHLEPIQILLRTGAIADRYACHQCYHPPLFSLAAAGAGQLLSALGLPPLWLPKVYQGVACLAGILTLGLLPPLLRRLPLLPAARVVALAVLIFLPRHVYMSAMLANDSLVVLLATACVVLLQVGLERRWPWPLALLTGLVALLAVAAKYTGLVVLPLLAIALAATWWWNPEASRQRLAVAALLVLLPASLLVAGNGLRDKAQYDTWVPDNHGLYNPMVQPQDPQGMEFFSFTPWQFWRHPLLVPGQMHSFWTLVHSSLWWDTEPKFQYITDRNDGWWGSYYRWLSINAPFPGLPPPLGSHTRTLAGLLLGLGFGWTLLGLAGLGRMVLHCLDRRSWHTPEQARTSAVFCGLLGLFLANVGGVVLLTLKAPLYSSVKGSYFCTSLAFFTVCAGLGAMPLLRHRLGRLALAAAAVLLILATVGHVAQSVTAALS